MTATGTPDGWGAAWADYDLDGDLDLAVAGWNGSSTSNKLFRNNGNDTFTDVTTSVGLNSLNGVSGSVAKIISTGSSKHSAILNARSRLGLYSARSR